MNKYFILITSSLLMACSNKAIYDNIQLNNRRACEKAPPSQYEECIKLVNKSYEDYEKERKNK